MNTEFQSQPYRTQQMGKLGAIDAGYSAPIPGLCSQKGIQPQIRRWRGKAIIGTVRLRAIPIQMPLLWEVPPDKVGSVLRDDADNITPGMTVITPSGRTAIVKKRLSGASKIDPFDRIVCRYVGGGARDLVTLQVQLVKCAATGNE